MFSINLYVDLTGIFLYSYLFYLVIFSSNIG